MATINIVRLVKKNKFGANTYYVQLDRLHRIEVNEMNNGSYIVEFFELGIMWPTRLFSFTSNKPIIEILSESMDRVANYFRTSDKYAVPEYIHVQDKKRVIELAQSLFKT